MTDARSGIEDISLLEWKKLDINSDAEAFASFLRETIDAAPRRSDKWGEIFELQEVLRQFHNVLGGNASRDSLAIPDNEEALVLRNRAGRIRGIVSIHPVREGGERSEAIQVSGLNIGSEIRGDPRIFNDLVRKIDLFCARYKVPEIRFKTPQSNPVIADFYRTIAEEIRPGAINDELLFYLPLDPTSGSATPFSDAIRAFQTGRRSVDNGERISPRSRIEHDL